MVQAEFELLAGTQVGAISKEVARHVDVIQYVGRLYSATDEVDEETFREFVAGALALHGDIEFIGWAPLLDDEWNAVFRASTGNAVRDSDADGRAVGVVVAGESDHHLPIYFAEPGGHGNPWYASDLAAESETRTLIADAGEKKAHNRRHTAENPFNG